MSRPRHRTSNRNIRRPSRHLFNETSLIPTRTRHCNRRRNGLSNTNDNIPVRQAYPTLSSQTLTMTNTRSLIYLHHPHSTIRLASYHSATTLASSSSTSSCTRLRTLQSLPLSAHIPHHDSPASNTHSHKLLRAADLLSNLATLPSTVLSRTPFFTCALAIAAVVHVAALAGGPPSSLAIKYEGETGAGKEQSLKARIELGVGALQVLGRAWPLARRVRGEMVDMYRRRC